MKMNKQEFLKASVVEPFDILSELAPFVESLFEKTDGKRLTASEAVEAVSLFWAEQYYKLYQAYQSTERVARITAEAAYQLRRKNEAWEALSKSLPILRRPIA